MKGTEKQIKWAEDIKAGMIAEVERFAEMETKDGETARADRYRSAIPWIESHDDAAWFINRGRHMRFTDIMAKAVR